MLEFFRGFGFVVDKCARGCVGLVFNVLLCGFREVMVLGVDFIWIFFCLFSRGIRVCFFELISLFIVVLGGGEVLGKMRWICCGRSELYFNYN